MASNNSNIKAVPEAMDALEKFKYEVASDEAVKNIFIPHSLATFVLYYFVFLHSFGARAIKIAPTFTVSFKLSNYFLISIIHNFCFFYYLILMFSNFSKLTKFIINCNFMIF